MSQPLGRYEILEEIGQGGFAIVYRARDTQLDRLVALKELRPALLNNSDRVKRFKQEARTIARLDHPRIVTVHDVIEAAERLLIVMRLVDGSSLDQLIATEGRFSWSRALDIISAVAEGLDYAHAQGILHRDLKPANILLDSTRGPLLSDFGLAKLVGEVSLTATGGIVGTPHYLAPEVWEGQDSTPQSDIYALGCILAEMLTGEKLFQGEASPTVMRAHFSPLTVPESWPAGTPAGISEVLRTALAKQPGERYATAEELVQALTQLTEGETDLEPAQSGLALYLLGPPRTELDDAPLEVDRRKAIALLIYLALTPQTHQRDALATLFWPDYDQRSARGNLRRTLSVLNRALGEGWLKIDRESVTLIRQPQLRIDVEEFRQLVATGESHNHPNHEICADCLPALDDAVALYRDDFLTGFTLEDSPDFDDWQLFQTENLRQDLTTALEKLVEGYSAQGDFKTALGYARRWLALDPLHEPAHRRLMQLYARSGDRAAALRQYDECVRLFDEELGLLPDVVTAALYEQIRAGDIGKGAETQRGKGAEEIFPLSEATLPSTPAPPLPSPSAPPPHHNLPAQTTPFIGRETELADLACLLADPAIRLVTILGPGGMGKTRLALEIAGRRLDHFKHRVYFVRLARLDTSESIVPAIAEALNFSFYEGGTPEQQLQDYLREKQLLLVMDNYEHLLGDAHQLEGAKVVADLLRIAPGLKILATSRARLNVQEEYLFPLTGIDFPEATDPEKIDQSSAVRLFAESARRVQTDFAVTDDNSDSVVQICRLVEGLPLGIILAATWLELLTPAEIADELARSLDFLETELRDLPERQRSMRAVFDHSWRLLSKPEQTVFQQLTVFRGGFTREAAEAVAEASLWVLMGLVNKSLLQREPTGRFEIHELLRQFGAEKLAQDSAQETTARDRHSAFYCAFLHQREADLQGGRQQAALSEIEVDLENVRRAWAWAIENGSFEAVEQALESLYEFYLIQSRFQEGHDTFGRAVTRIQAETQKPSEPTAELSEIVLTKLLARQGAFGSELGRPEAAREQIQHSLTLARRLDIPREQALCLNVLGDIRQDQGEPLEAEQQYQESLAISQKSGDQLAKAASLEKWGWMKTQQGDYDRAYRLFQQSLNLYRDVEHSFGIAKLLDRVALTALGKGQYSEAKQFWAESLTISKELGSNLGIASALGGLASVAWGLGGDDRLDQAEQLLQKRLAITQELGHPGELGFSFCQLAYIYNDMEDYQEARKYALEALKISKGIGYTWTISRSLSVLSVTAANLKDFQAAWNYIYEALEIAVDTQTHPLILLALMHLAILLAKDTNRFKHEETDPNEEAISIKLSKERAIEILTLVMNHPTTWQVYKDKAARLQVELATELPPEVVAAAQERGKPRDLMDTVRELLAELNNEFMD